MTEQPNKKAPFTDDDVEAHRAGLEGADEDVEGHRIRQDRNHPGFIDDDDADDVEGHRVRQDRNRPDFMPERNRPELLEDDDVEGHRLIGSNIQPPRDTDLGGSER